MNLFENLQKMSESNEDKIINVKLMDVEVLGDNDDYDAWDEHLNELANEYNITIEANGERSVLISGTKENIEEFLYSEYFLDFDSNHVVVIDTLKEAKEDENDDYVEYVFKKLYSQDQNNMDEEELKYYYDGVANGENDDFIDNVVDDLVNDYDYDYDYDFLDEYREEIIDKCAEMAQENGFGE